MKNRDPALMEVTRTQSIMVVDDSPDDMMLLQMAFRRIGLTVPTHMLEKGEEALAYLDGKGKYANRQVYPLPTLIIVDLKMPRVSGFDILSHVGKLQIQPSPFVVVMSSSSLPPDIEKAKSLGAFAFHTKPVAFTELCSVAERLSEFFHYPMEKAEALA